jgi:hypothetical protein
MTMYGGPYTGGSISPLSEAEINNITEVIAEVQKYCTSVEFHDAAAIATETLIHFKYMPHHLNPSSVNSEVRHVKNALEREMFNHKFVHVKKDRMGYLNKEKLFGEGVSVAFPSAAFDIAEAGNCLAVESNVATVYHLMCAVEYGLRAVAWDRRIVFPKGPIELQQWGDILKELDTAVFQIQQWPKSHTREAAHEFYNKAMLEIRSFNGAYRRHIMHSRERAYSRHDALAIFNHVKDFLRLLSTRISETKRTSLKWKGMK